MDFLLQPSTFTAAQDFFLRKVNLPTNLNSRELSNRLPEPIRAQAFFSAKVASAHILSALRAECQDILSGKRNTTDGVARLRQFLATEGYGIPAPRTREDADLQNLASDHRLRLVIDQNVAMSQAVGFRAVSEHPYVADRFPNYRYVANTDRHARYDGLVLPKNHPFWKTHFPPWDFNCNCMALDEDAEPNAAGSADRLDYRGQAVAAPDPESGFLFNSSPKAAFQDPDLSSIPDPDLRALVASAIRSRAA